MASKDLAFQMCMPLGRSMGAITKNYYGALSKRLEHLGIDRHFSILAVIDKTPEKCTQQYLSDFLRVDKVSMVRMLDYLYEKGLITRVVNPGDRREHIIQLTSKGRKIMPDIHEGIKEMNSIALEGLSKTEQDLLFKFMSVIMKNIQDLPVNAVDIKLKKK
jgi:DNA-binding MarR family transcriptional regulator